MKSIFVPNWFCSPFDIHWFGARCVSLVGCINGKDEEGSKTQANRLCWVYFLWLHTGTAVVCSEEWRKQLRGFGQWGGEGGNSAQLKMVSCKDLAADKNVNLWNYLHWYVTGRICGIRSFAWVIFAEIGFFLGIFSPWSLYQVQHSAIESLSLC